jgi:hypothetical protein
VTDLGTIAGATLAWSLNGSAWTTSALTGTGGPSARAYSGAIPTGANGVLRYQVNATNGAGISIASAIHTVVRGPLPKFSVNVAIDPSTCGTVSIGGVAYANGSTALLPPGRVALAASGCYPYNFTAWGATPALALAPADTNPTNLSVGGNGTVTAEFTYVRPFDSVAVGVFPGGCGSIGFNGVEYANGTFASLPYELPLNLSLNVTCAGYGFGGWAPSASLSILGSSLVVHNNGTLNVTLVPTDATDEIGFGVTPTGCGGVGYDGAGYVPGEYLLLAPGVYTLTPDPCAHWGFENFSVSGSLSISGSQLTVRGSGSVTEHNYQLTQAYVETEPGTCGGVTLDGTDYGNGIYVALQNRSSYTVTAFTCAGHYLDAFSATGGLSLEGSLLVVNGSGSLIVVSLPGTPTLFIGFVITPSPPGCVSDVLLNGTAYGNGAFASFPPDQVVPIAPAPCTGYGFVSWAVTGELAIVNGLAYLNGSGAITMTVGAYATLLFNTIPASCGAILIDGVPYLDNSSASLVDGANYSIAPAPCAHYELEEFESSPYVAIQNGTIAPDGPSTITAVYVEVPYVVRASVVGTGCGTLAIDGTPVGSARTFNLSFGHYPIAEAACLTSAFAGFTIGGTNPSIAAGTLYVNGSGSITASFLPILPSVTLGGSTSGFVGGTTLFYATIAVLQGTSGYTYLWSFGDGSTNTTTGNSTTHVYASAGTYTVAVEVIDPYHHTANATLTVTIVGQPATSYGTGFTTAIVLLVVALAIVALLVGLGRRRPPADAGPDGGASSAPPAEVGAPEDEAPTTPSTPWTPGG